MLRIHHPIAALLALAFAAPLFARGQFWDFLGYTQVDGGQDHGSIRVAHQDRFFRTIQLRVSGESIFLDRVVIHFANGTCRELVVTGRILSQEGNYLVDLAGERSALESIELWYFKEPWGQNPKVNLYGIRLPDPASESIASEH
jgi:hypothetical protein